MPPLNDTNDQEFEAAFGEASGSAPAGGMDIDAAATADAGAPAAQEGTDAAAEPAAAESDLPADGDAAPDAGAEAADPVVDAPAAAAAPADDLAKREQKLKSWEGRLKALAREIEGKGVTPPGIDDPEEVDVTNTSAADKGAEALEEVAEQAAEAGDTELAERADAVADKVETGKMTLEQALQQLGEDFGPDFVSLIEIVAEHKARAIAEETTASKIGEISDRVQATIDHIQNREQRAHFQAIAAAHPDFAELNDDAEFKAFVAEDPARVEIQSGGSAEDINKMLGEFKASRQGAAPEAEPTAAAAPAQDMPSDDDLDAAEGVAAGGMTLPAEPAEANDFNGAFAEATGARR